MTPQRPVERVPVSLQPLGVLLLLAAALTWAYWPSLVIMSRKWLNDPQYSHGYVVPAFALGLLWLRRQLLAEGPLRPSWWCVPLLLAAVALRVPAELYNKAQEWMEGGSLMLMLAGLCLLLGGLTALRWAWPSIGFLFFMLPMPYTLEIQLASQLRWLGTHLSTYALQTLGFAAVAEGNKILLDSGPLGVEDACSGLNMLITFVALSTAIIFLFEMPLLDKAVVLLSSVPIALVSNLVRIIVTAVLLDVTDRNFANKFFHDWAGYLMMVFGLGLLLLELWLLRRLLVVRDPATSQPQPVPLSEVRGQRSEVSKAI